MKVLISEGYPELLRNTKDRVHSAQYAAIKEVNRGIIALYWDIGRMIVEKQNDINWRNAAIKQLAADLDEYPFDFLELGEEHSEPEIEQAMISRIDHFFREMDGNFSFLSNQYRLQVSDKKYSIVLLLFPTQAAAPCSHLAEELGIPAGIHRQDAIIPCCVHYPGVHNSRESVNRHKSKTENRIIVEYAFKNSGKPIGVDEYRIVSKLLKYLRRYLPKPE